MTRPDAPEKPRTPPADDVPPGDSPPKPWWPLYLAAAAWGAWMLFLVVMLILRLKESATG